MALDTTIVGSDDDSIRAFYAIEEVSESSGERRRSDGSLATSTEARLLDSSEAEDAPGALGKTSPGSNSTNLPKPQVQNLPIPRELVRERFRRLQPTRIPSKEETVAQQGALPAKEGASTSEHSDTRTREDNTRGGGIDEPVEVPPPQSPDDQGTSNEPQLPGLAALDGILPQAPVVRTSSSGGLVSSGGSRPQRYPETSIEREVLARGFYRRPHLQENRAESSRPAPSKNKSPVSHSRPNIEEASANRSTDGDATEENNSEEYSYVLNEPTIDSSGNAHVQLLNGNLVIDYRCLNKYRHWMVKDRAKLKGNEWDTWRFTAVTCPPRQFTAENYRLRPLLSLEPKPISTILSFRLRHDESSAQFAKRWSMIRTGLRRHVLGRDSLIVHVHVPWTYKLLDNNISQALREMCIYRNPEPPIASLDGRNLFHRYDGRGPTVLGKKVHCVMREAS